MRPLKNEQGFVLLLVYTVVIFISIFAVAFFARHRTALQATERYQNRVLAFNAAEAGIDYALRELATNSSRRSQTESGTYTSAYMPLTKNEFRYTISPVPGKPNFRRIDSKGCAPNCDAVALTNQDSTIRAYQTSDITVFCQITTPAPPPSLFEYGIYAGTSISLNGDTTAFDSYNSNQGAYGGSNISSQGAIAGNTSGIGSIFLKHTTVNGNVVVATSANPSVVIETQGASITGTTGTLADGWSLPEPPEIPADATSVDLTVSGNNTLTLAAGTYVTPTVQISGNGSIVASGPVTIYVTGAIDITGNGITVPDNHPANLLLISTGSASVKIAGNGSFYGGIYAPDSNVTSTGNGDIFGAIVSKTFTQGGNSAFHFDLAMKENQTVDPNQTNIVRITAWQELNSLSWGTGV